MSPDKDSLASGADEVAGDPEGEINWQERAEKAEAGLEEVNQSVEGLKVEQDQNIRRLQSSLTAQGNAQASQSNDEKKRWENAYHEEKMSGMEAEEALRYDNARLAQELTDSQGQTTQAQRQVGEMNAKQNYINHFTTMGVPVAELNRGGTLQELSDSGYKGLEVLRASEATQLAETRLANEKMTAEIEKLKGGTGSDPNALAESQGDLKPTRVATLTHGAAGDNVRTWEDAMKEASNVTGRPVTDEEEVWRLVEQKILPSTVIPGLENPPTE